MNITSNTARTIATGTIVVITTGSTKTRNYRQVTAKVTGQTFVAIPGTEFGVWKTVAVTADGETITDQRIRPASAEEADAFTAAVTPAPVVWPAASRFVAWFEALVDQNLECTDTEEFERTAYRGHIGYNLSMTDGYYAPEDFDRWVTGFRTDPAGALYYGNDARHALAPTVRSYTTQLSA